ncbi:MAG: outer membrane beta-barrel protein, partial [Janthinobacterium lividum]
MKFLLVSLLTTTVTAAIPCPAQSVQSPAPSRADEIRELKLELKRISARLDALESADPAATAAVPSATPDLSSASAPQSTLSGAPIATAEVAPAQKPEDAPVLSFLQGTTVGFGLDGYYGYNFNQPVGRVNLLRVYDVSSNSFSINQASFIVEHLPTPTERFGGRLDFQYGQATETLQGSSANEQRPQVYRNLFQAYGS